MINSMNVKILIASHISSFKRELCAYQLFESIEESIIRAYINDPSLNIHIYVSYSMEKEHTSNDVYKEIQKKHNGGGMYSINIFNHFSRMYQFEHYLFLSQYINDQDIVIFSDDDDLFYPERISSISKAFCGRTHNIVHHLCTIFTSETFDPDFPLTYKELLKNPKKYIQSEKDEYFCYSLKGNIFKEEMKYFVELRDKSKNEKILPMFDIIFMGNISGSRKEEILDLSIPLQYYRGENYTRNFNVKN